MDLCKDLSCSIFEETGQTIGILVSEFIDDEFIAKESKDDIRLCVVEEEIRSTHEKYFLASFEIGSKNDCEEVTNA
jgi:hypothetical protein